jgi:hypothetical protein
MVALRKFAIDQTGASLKQLNFFVEQTMPSLSVIAQHVFSGVIRF